MSAVWLAPPAGYPEVTGYIIPTLWDCPRALRDAYRAVDRRCQEPPG